MNRDYKPSETSPDKHRLPGRAFDSIRRRLGEGYAQTYQPGVWLSYSRVIALCRYEIKSLQLMWPPLFFFSVIVRQSGGHFCVPIRPITLTIAKWP